MNFIELSHMKKWKGHMVVDLSLYFTTTPVLIYISYASDNGIAQSQNYSISYFSLYTIHYIPNSRPHAP